MKRKGLHWLFSVLSCILAALSASRTGVGETGYAGINPKGIAEAKTNNVKSRAIRSGEPSAHGKSSSPVIRYFKARGRDFLDIFEVRAGLKGPYCDPGWIGMPDWMPDWFGFADFFIPEVDIEATCLAHLAVGHAAEVLWGTGGPDDGALFEEIMGFPFSGLHLSQFCGRPGALTLHSVHVDRPFIHDDCDDLSHDCCLIPLLLTLDHGSDGWKLAPPRDDPLLPPIRWADVGGGIAVFPLAFRLSVSPGEMLDFFMGWFGIDLDPESAKIR